jgi:hypothetical protein
MIVVDASALLEALLRTPAARTVENGYSNRDRRFVRLICSISKLRRSSAGMRQTARSTANAAARLSPTSLTFPSADTA